jgi:hypothetical protein
LRKPFRIFRLLLVPDSSLKEPPGLKGTGPVPFYRQGRNNLLHYSAPVNGLQGIFSLFGILPKPPGTRKEAQVFIPITVLKP